jgi:hypothetical protein
MAHTQCCQAKQQQGKHWLTVANTRCWQHKQRLASTAQSHQQLYG